MLLLRLVVSALAWRQIGAEELSGARLQKVYDVMNQISTMSWENGTKAQAIIEWRHPSISVFSATPPLPVPNPLPSGDISEIISIAQTTLQNRPPATNSSSPLLEDGAAGDPASLGVAVLLANNSQGNLQVNGVGYLDAATSELNYLMEVVPRTNSGAISHRTDQAQLWADSVYMVPPFLAYYGALTANSTLLQAAYDQCRLYRETLRQSSGLWYHILLGNGTQDANTWLTGNAWAATGMLRVWATIQRSSLAGNFGSQLSDLGAWTQEILAASQPLVTSNGLLRNYMMDTDSFEDTAGSALMAAAGLRLSTLNITNTYANLSVTLLSAVSQKVNSTGYLTQAVNPVNFAAQGTQSPEGQSFILLAYSAYYDWVKAGKQGFSSSSSPLGSTSAADRAVGVMQGLVGVAVVGMGLAVLL